MRYDRLYDRGRSRHVGGTSCCIDNCFTCNEMREPGFEPGRLAAPDPKSERPTGKVTPSEVWNAIQRHASPPNASTTVTDCTTDAHRCASFLHDLVVGPAERLGEDQEPLTAFASQLENHR